MKVKAKGRLIKENTKWEIVCDLVNDNYVVSQRDISVVITLNGVHHMSLKEYFKVEVLQD